MKVSSKIKGMDLVVNQLKTFPKEAEKKIQGELNAFGMETVADAKRLTPVNEGLLRNSIQFDISGTTVKIMANVGYAAYVEFGTRKFAAQYVSSLPSNYQDFALQFKGKGGGTLAEMVENITEWARKKGIENPYPIVLKILRDGIRPQPFLVPAIRNNFDKLKKRLSKI